MKKFIALSAIVISSLIYSCNNNKEQPTTPAPEPEPIPAPAPVPEKHEDGTTIKMNDEGVSYENKNGKSKTDVNISEDSSSVEIKRPK